MSRSRKSPARRSEAMSKAGNQRTTLKFRCREHRTLLAIEVWMMDGCNELTDLEAAFANAFHHDSKTDAWVLACECPRCRRPLIWTAEAVRAKIEETRAAGQRAKTVSF